VRRMLLPQIRTRVHALSHHVRQLRAHPFTSLTLPHTAVGTRPVTLINRALVLPKPSSPQRPQGVHALFLGDQVGLLRPDHGAWSADAEPGDGFARSEGLVLHQIKCYQSPRTSKAGLPQNIPIPISSAALRRQCYGSPGEQIAQTKAATLGTSPRQKD
jgi:hypothetical protein